MQHARAELCADREIVMAAIKNKSIALKYASADLRADREVVLTAVRNCTYSIRYANESLVYDRTILQYVEQRDIKNVVGVNKYEVLYYWKQ